MAKENSEKYSEKQPRIQITPRRIKSTRGGFMNVRRGRTEQTQNLQTNPLYQTLFKRRGYSKGFNRGGLLSSPSSK